MKFIFLDIDGCLNDHTKMENTYCGMLPARVSLLNQLLHDEDVWLVISSAWRYLVIRKDMTLRGLEELLLSHGICCYRRVHGITNPDEMYWPANPTTKDWEDLTVRVRQIEAYVQLHNPESFVVFDDLDLPMEKLLRTDGSIGLTQDHIDRARAILNIGS